MSLSPKTKKWLKSNADISLEGKTVVVTGANSGVGFKTAETMLYLGARVILACRNPQRAEDARKALAADYPDSTVTVMLLDLADFSSIDAFVSSLQQQGTDIDVFVNNAGCFHHPGITLTPLGLNAVKKGIANFAMALLTPFFNTNEKSSLSVAYILSNSLPVGSIVGPNKVLGGWGYPTVNPILKKYKTGAEELIAFTENEIKR